MIIAEEYLCRAANDFAKSAQDFYCSAPATPEVWSATGTWAGVVVAAIVGIYARLAWRTSQHQLKMTRDIALNDQRVPRLSQLLEIMSLRFGTEPEFRDSLNLDESKAEVLQLHDRWALTYPEIYRDGHFRDVIGSLADLTKIQILLSNTDPRTAGPALTDAAKFSGRRHDGATNLTKKIDVVKELCLDLHTDGLSESAANEQLRLLARELQADVEEIGGLTPMWRISSISQLF